MLYIWFNEPLQNILKCIGLSKYLLTTAFNCTTIKRNLCKSATNADDCIKGR